MAKVYESNVMTDHLAPYMRGSAAAYRIDEYEDCTATPNNPYPEGTTEADDWQRGYDDSIEHMLSPEYRDS